MGISRDHWHKRRATGGKPAPIRKKRKYELGRPAANTKLGAQRVHLVRSRGGNQISCPSFRHWQFLMGIRMLHPQDPYHRCVYNELVRTNPLVKNAIVVVDATPFRQWYESNYLLPLARKKGAKLTEAEDAIINKKSSQKTAKKYVSRQRTSKVDGPIEEQFHTGRLLTCVASRAGTCGRADVYILEGKELEIKKDQI